MQAPNAEDSRPMVADALYGQECVCPQAQGLGLWWKTQICYLDLLQVTIVQQLAKIALVWALLLMKLLLLDSENFSKRDILFSKQQLGMPSVEPDQALKNQWQPIQAQNLHLRFASKEK